MITRRALLVGSGAVSITAGVHDDAQRPPAKTDAYGLDKLIGPNDLIERTLRLLGEPALLPAPGAAPAFRLLELYSFRKPRSARIAFEASGKAHALVKELDKDALLLEFGEDHGVRLRALIDDRERFWDTASVPADWDQIDADASGEVLVRGDGGSSLLEARVGGRHHALLRRNPEPDTLIGQLSPELFLR